MANLTADYIRAAYSGILGREADPAGLDHYLAQAAEGLSRQELVRLLTTSEEFPVSRRRPASSIWDRMEYSSSPTG